MYRSPQLWAGVWNFCLVSKGTFPTSSRCASGFPASKYSLTACDLISGWGSGSFESVIDRDFKMTDVATDDTLPVERHIRFHEYSSILNYAIVYYLCTIPKRSIFDSKIGCIKMWDSALFQSMCDFILVVCYWYPWAIFFLVLSSFLY